MLRITRPLLQRVTKTTTGLTGLTVHANPLPALTQTYEQTLELLSTIPEFSTYRQGAEALTRHKLTIIQNANNDIAQVEKGLDEGQIEEALEIAQDELSLVGKMVQWKAWEPLEEKSPTGQWEYVGKIASS